MPLPLVVCQYTTTELATYHATSSVLITLKSWGLLGDACCIRASGIVLQNTSTWPTGLAATLALSVVLLGTFGCYEINKIIV